MKCKVYVSNEAYDAYRNATLWKNFLRMVAIDFSGIKHVEVSDAVEVARYDIQGRQLTQPTQGLNIIKLSNGKSQYLDENGNELSRNEAMSANITTKNGVPVCRFDQSASVTNLAQARKLRVTLRTEDE